VTLVFKQVAYLYYIPLENFIQLKSLIQIQWKVYHKHWHSADIIDEIITSALYVHPTIIYVKKVWTCFWLW